MPGEATQGLRELDVHLFLEALLDVLCDKAPKRQAAALDALSIFADTVLMLHSARASVAALTGKDPWDLPACCQ